MAGKAGDRGSNLTQAQVTCEIVTGFDPSSVLPTIETALSPRFHLDAQLEDVVVYENHLGRDQPKPKPKKRS